MKLRWPLPALAIWLGAWLLWHALPKPWDAALSTLAVLVALVALQGRTRRLVVLGGWLASLWLLSGADRLPPWAWLLALAVLLLAYPVSAWRDAPVFPTPVGALDRLSDTLQLQPGDSALDAGCGAGHGLQALRRAFPQVRCVGVERSWIWWAAARWRCPWAVIFHADLWKHSWSGHALVYLFQRPESMERAWRKARAEMLPGQWLVSLEFPIPQVRPHARYALEGDRTVWIYRIPEARRSSSAPARR